LVDNDQLSLAIGKKGQNARLTAKLTGWRVDIEKAETVELNFEEKVARAVKSLSKLPGVDAATAQLLVTGGFHSMEGVLSADMNDLIEIIGEEKAKAIHEAAAAEQERQEGTAPAQ
jgi:N utilization substance protein A